MTITQVSKEYEITADTLRYYEKIGLLPNVSRNKNGIRMYSEEDCRWIEFIKCMRGAGLSIEVLSKYISLFYLGDKTVLERKKLLEEQLTLLKDKRRKIDETIEKLEYKVKNYETFMVNLMKD